uniref:Uncharacterized protein NT03AP0008 n=1 Tax=Alvinella pompejana epibiont 7G3 TaxID=244800 RepID=Q6W3M0_9BACT|nr:conserved hypothetical protein [Alvinella pompejana epibiont 7G3]
MKNPTIGVTGHRDIVVTEKLKQDIKEFFLNIKHLDIKLFSPLADGADRLVADIYLDVFKDNAHLVVPMPFDKKRYMEDFDENSKKEFLDYLKVADEVFEVKNSDGCNYKSVGVYVADKSDILLALWDGTFNNKSGGTGDIVQYARERCKKIVHFLCERIY